MDAIRSVGGVPRILRADNGSENFHIAVFQRFFRRKAVDAFAEEKSFMSRSRSRHSEINYAEVAWVFKDLRDNCSAKTTFPHRSYTILFYVYYT
mgnify:FL=1